MAFTRPTLNQIIDRIKGDIKTGLTLTAILRRSFLDILSKALGGASHTLHGHLDFNALQLFPDTATEENLVRWATLFGLARLDASFAELTIDIIGTTGGTLLVDTIFQRSDGLQYKVKDEVIVPAATTLPATIVAVEANDSENEKDFNLDNGSTVSLLSPVSGLDSNALVTATIIEGEDEETIEALRIRVLERMQAPPAGGKVTDYIAFAKSVSASVTRVWVLPGALGEGTVSLTFVEDNESPIIPSVPKVAEIQEGVEPLIPVSVDLFVFAPIETELNPEIALKPNTTETQAAATAELEDMLLRNAEVRDASDPAQVGLGVQFDGIITLSKMNEAISIAQGEDDHVLTSPTSDVQPVSGGLVTLGTPIFSTLV